MPEVGLGVDGAVVAAAPEESMKQVAETVNGAMDLNSPSAARIAAALEIGAQAHEKKTNQRIVVVNPEEMPEDLRAFVKRMQDLDQALMDNRHNGVDRLKGSEESPKNIKDPELEKKLQEEMQATLKLRSTKLNDLAKQILFLCDWYQCQPGLKHLPTHALQFKEVITKPPQQTKGLRRVKTPG